MHCTEQKELDFEGRSIAYFESNIENRNKALLLHGYSFESGVWERAGVIESLNRLGYASYALDVPGFPNSRNKMRINEQQIYGLLSAMINKVLNAKPLLIGASASGHIALKFAERYESGIRALVAIGPVNFESIDIGKIAVPILGVWGSKDRISDAKNGAAIFKSAGKSAVIIAGAGHACYLEKPNEFSKAIGEFVKTLP
ncbi:MAG: alpha/beta hydrolase [Candidatus Micrarchaeaceae archaeon]